MTQLKRLFAGLLHSPVLWGGLVTGLYYAALLGGVIAHPLLLRFTAGHTVEYLVTAFFFVGVAALVIKGVETAIQRRLPADPLLGPVPLGGQPVAEATNLMARLDGRLSICAAAI